MSDFNQSLPLPNQSNTDDPSSDTSPNSQSIEDPALQLIRNKVNKLYQDEPSAIEEKNEIIATGAHSKHQKYMQQLLDSGKDMAVIQKEWHAYYQQLPADEKHQVWNEFYANYSQINHLALDARRQAAKHPHHSASNTHEVQAPNKKPLPPSKRLPSISHTVVGSVPVSLPPHSQKKVSTSAMKEELIQKVTAQGRLKPKHHLQSLLFGLGMGTLVVGVLMFGFFNERFIAPFLTPSLTASSSPIIVDPNEKVGPESKVIIPKINVDVPVVYNTPSTSEKDIQASLEKGVVHYPGTPVPGQNGNVVVVGHSSNNLLNTGKYKFAFVLLNKLQVGDTITMQYDGKRYVYKVYETTIVKPTDVGVLGPTDRTATLTLITCDPPGTSINRLIVRAEQISPDVNSNLAAAPATELPAPEIVPGNAPSLFSRLFSWL